MNDITVKIDFYQLKDLVVKSPEIVGSITEKLEADQYKTLLKNNIKVFEYIPNEIKTEEFCLWLIRNRPIVPVYTLEGIVKIHKTKDIYFECIKKNLNFFKYIPKKHITADIAAYYVSKEFLSYSVKLLNEIINEFSSIKDDLCIELIKINNNYFKVFENPSEKVIDFYKVILL